MRVFDGLMRLCDPRKVIACSTIFLVVHALDTDDSTVDDVMLLSELCPDCDLASLASVSADDFPDFDYVDDNKPLHFIEDTLLEDDINVSYAEVVPSPEQQSAVEWWGKVFVPSPLPRSRCEQQVNQYLHDLGQFQLWAIQMWDATAKPPAGLLSGNSYQLGDYDSCLTAGRAELGVVQAQYCLALVDLRVAETAPPGLRAAVHRLQAGSFVRSKHSDPGHFVPRWSTLHWGLCVPASCSAGEVQAGLQAHLATYHLPGVTVDAAVPPGHCYLSATATATASAPQLPLPTLITLGFFGGILMLAVVSTIVDSKNNFPLTEKLSTRDRALLAFSLRRNWQSLVSRQTDELPVIHGVRSVFTVMLYIAHKVMPLSLTPYTNRADITQCSHSELSAVFRASSVFTDSFLHLSAVLAAFNLSRELSRHGVVPWHTRILARLIRLTPALLAVVLFYAYVMEHLGSGPQWHSAVTTNADLCKQHLWRNIIYIQNFFQFEEMCATHTHQLALDMQLFLLAPAVVYCLHRWPRLSLTGLAAGMTTVAALRYYTHLEYHLSDFIYHNVSLSDLYRTANLSYSQPVFRAIPYIVGLLTGFYLQRCRKLLLTQLQVLAGWTACAVLAALSVFYPAHLTQPGVVFDSRAPSGALYAALSPLAWATALTWLIIACSSGYGGGLHRLLCRHGLVVFSRLSYTIYLTQFIVFFYQIGSVRSSQEFSLLYVIGVYEIGSVMLISLVVTFLFDLPMQEIKCILLPGRKGRKLDKVS